MTTELTYDNRTGREPGPFLRTLSTLLPGVRRVRAQVAPYARSWHAHNRATIGRPGRRWIVLGDSMSQAVGASRWDAGWVDQLAGRLAHDGHHLHVVNLSATGAKVRDVIEQQLPVLDALGRRDDDLVTVLVGSNDLLGGRSGRAALPVDFGELVDRLPRGAVVATLPQPRAAATAANRHVERAGAAGRLVVLDLRANGPTSWRGRLADDWFHPNDAGYAAISDAFEGPVRQALADAPD